jgi:hypothetical protein
MLRLPSTLPRTPAQHDGLDYRNEYIGKRTINTLITNGNCLCLIAQIKVLYTC